MSVSVGSYSSGTVAGDYEVVVTTDPEKAAVTGDVMIDGGNIGFDSAADTVSIADASLLDLSFKISVDGTESNTITLTGSYSTTDELAAELQSMINGDDNLSDVNVAVDVAYNSTDNTFSFTSRSYGSSSKVIFDSASFGADIAELGFTDLSDTGVNAAGTIAGETAFGSGNVLLPPIDTDAYGLNFTIGENAVAAGAITTSFSRGFGGELTNLIDAFLASSGTIQLREENMNTSLENIAVDREELDRKMTIYEEMLFSKYAAMEAILNSFSSTSSQLDGLVDRLPLTASNG